MTSGDVLIVIEERMWESGRRFLAVIGNFPLVSLSLSLSLSFFGLVGMERIQFILSACLSVEDLLMRRNPLDYLF